MKAFIIYTLLLLLAVFHTVAEATPSFDIDHIEAEEQAVSGNLILITFKTCLKSVEEIKVVGISDEQENRQPLVAYPNKRGCFSWQEAHHFNKQKDSGEYLQFTRLISTASGKRVLPLAINASLNPRYTPLIDLRGFFGDAGKLNLKEVNLPVETLDQLH